ncbi:MAG: hypothetical protein IJ268_06605, partial [Proteobacteria bacterium]|nr:hypothetical protein [Pseudomonadota bacterium]
EYADFSTAKSPGYAGVSTAKTPGYAGVSPAIKEENTNKALQAICQKAKEMQVWQPFMICYLLLNGPQTQRMLIDAYNPNQTSGEDNKCRSILYWIANSRDWLTRTGERYNQYFSIPDEDACLADPYVLKIIAGVIQYLDKLPKTAPAAPVIEPDDQTKHSIAPDDQTRRNIEQILAQNFQYGYTHGIRQQEKFKEAYQNTFGKAIDCEDLDATIDSIAFLIDDRAFSFDAVLPQPRLEKLTRTIDNLFEDGAPFIEYDALLQTCELMPIQTAIVLRAYLSHHFRDRYTFAQTTFAPNPAPELDEPLPETIANEVLYTGDITSLDTIAERFPYLTRETIASHLSANEDILVDKENIMHTEAVGLDESDIDTLRNTLNTLLDANPVLSYKQFIDELTESDVSGADQLSNLLDASPALLQQYLFRKLGDEFSFAKAISRLEDESGQISDTSIADIMANEFSGKTRIEMDEIEEVIKRYGLVDFQPQVFRFLYDNYCRVSKDLFASNSELEFDIKAIDQAIDKQCQGDYMPVQDLTLVLLPYVNYPWTEYLLINYLYRYSRQFSIKNKTVTTKLGTRGMIVRKNSSLDIPNYNNILIYYISQSIPFPKDTNELYDLLLDHGLITRKSSTISSLLAKAKNIKETQHV